MVQRKSGHMERFIKPKQRQKEGYDLSCGEYYTSSLWIRTVTVAEWQAVNSLTINFSKELWNAWLQGALNFVCLYSSLRHAHTQMYACVMSLSSCLWVMAFLNQTSAPMCKFRKLACTSGTVERQVEILENSIDHGDKYIQGIETSRNQGDQEHH